MGDRHSKVRRTNRDGSAGTMRGARQVALAAALVLCGALSSATAAAQGPRRGGSFGPEPRWWGSVDGGYLWSNLVGDPGTSSIWDFDANWGLRLTVERAIAPRTTIGIGYMYTRLPVTIRPNSSASVCRFTCDGNATIARFGVVAHSGGGPGLHLVYEGFLGAAQFGHFTVSGDGSSVFSDVKNTDLAWSIATGAGYGLSNDLALQALFDYGSSLHEKANDLFQRRTTQQYMIRFGVRVGL